VNVCRRGEVKYPSGLSLNLFKRSTTAKTTTSSASPMLSHFLTSSITRYFMGQRSSIDAKICSAHLIASEIACNVASARAPPSY
jgi:hypothetical protein